MLFFSTYLYRITCALLLTVGAQTLAAQDVSGTWRGELTQEPGGCFAKYFIELQMQLTGIALTGTSYDYYDSSKYVKLNFAGRLNPNTRRMVLIENSIIHYQIPANCIPCIKTYDLVYTKSKDEELLSGTWKGTEMQSQNACPTGKIFLRRVKTPVFKPTAFIQPEQLAIIQKRLPPVTRKVELVKTITIDQPSIDISLYDNGQVDGDTISVFLNGELIMYRKGLSQKAVTLNIPVEEGKDYEMVMFAENLGLIPPNTALMVVTSGKYKYEVYLSSNEVKSAAVRFRYR